MIKEDVVEAPASWSAAESAMWHAFRRGEQLDLRAWDDRRIGASSIAQLLIAGPEPEPGHSNHLRLCGAVITGSLNLSAAQVEAPIRFSSCLFEEEVVLDGARLANVHMTECQLLGLSAISAQFDQWLGFPDSHFAGEVQLFNSRISGTVEFDGCYIGGALTLGRAVVEGGLHLRRGCEVNGKLRLNGIQVQGALLACGLVVNGQIDAIGARIGDALSFVDVTVRHPRDWALIFTDVQASRVTLHLNSASTGAVTLRDAHFGRLIDDIVNWPPACLVDLGGFTYDRLSERTGVGLPPTVEERLLWLRTYGVLNGDLQPSVGRHFAPGPYEQLAGALRQEGREQESRAVLREMERLRHRAWGRLGAWWGTVQDVMVGFGYLPGRALLWLSVLLFSAMAYFQVSGPLARVKPGEGPTWDPFLYSLDVVVPFISLGHDTVWDPTGWDKVISVLLMVAGWVLVTTIIAGIGRTLKR
ncbi:hypothetical protein [Streptomyces yangpuensis]|uniref:hypothetical protein n=1 Tax=Streptomyces yangpuensis TaxID=1648182 RepID=UPI00371DCDCD